MRILLAILLLFLFASCSFAAIRVSPSYVELNSKTTKKNFITGSFSVQGGDNETVRFKVYPEFFTISPNGKLEVNPEINNENSLVNKIRFVPSEFTVKNGKAQTVRFTIPGLKNLPDGESRVVLFLEDINTREVFLKNADGSSGGKLVIKTRVGVPIYLDNGKFTKVGQIESLVLNKAADKKEPFYEIKVVSDGNSKIRYTGIGQIIDENNLVQEFKVNSKAVPGGGFIKIKDTLPAEKLNPNKEYKLRLILTYRDSNNKKQNMIKEINFSLNSIKKEVL